MARFEIEIKRSAAKELEALPKGDLKRVVEKIEALADNPRPPDAIKLSASEYYKIRCGVYRVLYLIEDAKLIVCVVKVGHRKKEVYR